MTEHMPDPRPTPLLDAISDPADLKTLARAELPLLAAEIRAEIIRVVTQTGGHLASSLGTVELILALHYVLDLTRDRVVFDVGHQAYAHKILTGRRAAFENLRREGGLAGFPKRAESRYDHFDTGHSSTSVSAALGLAAARDMAGENHHVAAVLGDGALTGGLALEAMNHAGALKKNLMVILNDNNMSISPNVGGLSECLSLMVTRPAYLKLRKKIKRGMKQCLPTRGQWLISVLGRIENAVKSVFTSPSTLFEAVGFKYLGPFDGHDTSLLIDGLTGAASLEGPVLLHVITTKGKGYPPAENDPCAFHGVGVRRRVEDVEPPARSPADVRAAVSPASPPAPAPAGNFSDVFGRFLLAEAARNPKVVAISAAMSEGTGLADFFAAFPDRSFDVGIAEQHAVTLAAGLAAGGFRPVAAMYSTFLQRAFDQLFHDVALQNLPVMLAVDRAGLVGEDGPTHHGGLDLSYLRLLPHFTVMAPADAAELEAMLALGLSLDGPSAVRYPRGAAPAAGTVPPAPLALGRGTTLRDGSDVTIVALGPAVGAALQAADRLAAQGLSVGVINPRFIKPFDRELVLAAAEKTGRLLTVEENTLAGGLFGVVSEVLAGRPLHLRGLGLTDEAVPQATQTAQRRRLGLDAEGLCRAALALMARPKGGGLGPADWKDTGS